MRLVACWNVYATGLRESKSLLVTKVAFCSLQPLDCFLFGKAARIPWFSHVSICRVKIASKGGLRLEAAIPASRVQSALLGLLGRVWQGLSFDVGHHQARPAASICHPAIRNVQQAATLK